MQKRTCGASPFPCSTPTRANDPHSKPTDVCFGRNFRWEMEAPVFSYRANNPPGDGALVMMGWDFKVIEESAAEQLYNVVS